MADDIKAKIVFDMNSLSGAMKNIAAGSGARSALSSGAAVAGGVAGIAAGGVLAALKGITDVLKKVWGMLKEASPQLAATVEIGKKALSMFIRPFGDMISVLLRPALIALLKMSIEFYTFTKSTVWEALVTLAKLITSGGWLKIIGEKVTEFVKDVIFGDVDIGEWFKEKAGALWKWSFPIIEWIKEKIGSATEWGFDIITWLKNKFTSYWTFDFDLISWIKDRISGRDTSGTTGGAVTNYGMSSAFGTGGGTTGGTSAYGEGRNDPYGQGVTVNINALDPSSIDDGIISKIRDAVESSTKKVYNWLTPDAWSS